jgi:ferredoxin
MKEIMIESSKCKKCKVCMEICPNVISQLDNKTISIRPERIDLYIMCGQCMAACSEKAILVKGLDSDKDFFDLPEYNDLVYYIHGNRHL